MATLTYYQKGLLLFSNCEISRDCILTALDDYKDQILGIRTSNTDTTGLSTHWVLLFNNSRTPRILINKYVDYYPSEDKKGKPIHYQFAYSKPSFFPIFFGYTQYLDLFTQRKPHADLFPHWNRIDKKDYFETKRMNQSDKLVLTFVVDNNSRNATYSYDKLYITCLTQGVMISKVKSDRFERVIRPGKSYSQKLEFKPPSDGSFIFVLTAYFTDPRLTNEKIIISGAVSIQVIKDKPVVIPKPQVILEPIWDSFNREEIISPMIEKENNYLSNQLVEITDDTPIEERWKLDRELLMKIYNNQSVYFGPWNTLNNYVDRFHNLLLIEEAQQRTNLYSFNLQQQNIFAYYSPERSPIEGESFVIIYLKGISQIRPALMRGDHLCAFLRNNIAVKFKGAILELRSDHIIVSFPSTIDRYLDNDQKFDIEFLIPRDFFIRLHEALESLKSSNSNIVSKFIQSNEHSFPIQQTFSKNVQVFDPNMSKDQKKALNSIVKFNHNHLPFILSGPFGTGKTRTLIEATKEISMLKPDDDNQKILISTKTNSAANEIFAKLMNDKQFAKFGKVCYRIFNENMKLQTVTTRGDIDINTLITNSNYNLNYGFRAVNIEDIRKPTIIITTCNYSFVLKQFQNEIKFSHIIIDEAAQIMEPEAIVPLSLSNPNTSIILAGDPQQLGPRIFSPVASHHQLNESLLERLLRQYKEYYGDTRCHKRLIINFRICQSLIGLTNTLSFVDSISKAEDKVDFLTIPQLQGAKSPVMFHSVEGKDEKDKEIPSFYNLMEVNLTVQYILQLVEGEIIEQVHPKNIAVVSEFESQNRIIRLRLRELQLSEITVCTPHGIQGLEYQVVIVNTVRSSVDSYSYDRQFDLGFLNRKSLITTLSRASSLVVIIGNANVFCTHNPEVMDFIRRNGKIVGSKPDPKVISQYNTTLKEYNRTEGKFNFSKLFTHTLS